MWQRIQTLYFAVAVGLLSALVFGYVFDDVKCIDFEEGLKNDDTVLLGDLAEYEICPRLETVSQALKNL